MENPFADLAPKEVDPQVNPFSDLAPKVDQSNPFADVAPGTPQMVDLSKDTTSFRQRDEEPEPGFDVWGLPTAPMVDAYLGRITQNRDRAANIMAMAEMYHPKFSASMVHDHYDELNTLKDQPESYKFLPQLAIAGGMLAAPVAIAAGAVIPGLTVAGGTTGVKAAIPMWKFLLGAGAFTAAEEVNAFVRSRVEGKRFSETKPYSLIDLASVDANESVKTLLGVVDLMAKGKAVHSGMKGLSALWEPLTRDVIVEHAMPRRVYVDANLASDVMRGTATEEQMSMWRDLGVTADELRAAKHGAFQLEIQAENLIKIADKPWYAKLKSLFRVSPYEETRVEPGGKRTVTPVGGLLEEPGKEAKAGAGVEVPPVTPRPVVIPEAYQPMVQQIAAAVNVPADLVARVARAESNWNPAASSSAGAVGLMQLMPGTARDLGVVNPTDPYESLKGGATYLGQLLKRYNGDETRALVGYNWGPRNADTWDGNPASLPKETQGYLQAVQGGSAGGPSRIAPRPSRVDMSRAGGGLTSEGLLDGLARGNVDFMLSPEIVYRDVLGTPNPDATLYLSGNVHGQVDQKSYFVLGSVTDIQETFDIGLPEGLSYEGSKKFVAKRFNEISDELKSKGFEIYPEIDGYGHPTAKVVHVKTKEALARLRFKSEEKWKDAKPVFVRYGNLPKGGKSKDYSSGNMEKGVSVFRGEILPNGEIRPIIKTDQQLGSFLMGGLKNRTAYVVEGKEVGFGADGEPVLSNAKKLTPKDAARKLFKNVNMGLSEGAPNADLNNEVGDALYFPTTPEQIGTVERALVAELGDEVRGTIRTPTAEITGEQHRAGGIARQIGLEPVFFESTHPDLQTVGGFIERSNPGVIYLNANPLNDAEVLVYHEAMHSLSVTDKDAYTAILSEVMNRATDFDEYDAQLDRMRADIGLPVLPKAAVQEEFVSDLAGRLVTGRSNKAFDVADYVEDHEALKKMFEESLGVSVGGVGEGVSFGMTERPKFQTYDDVMQEASQRAHDVIQERMAKEAQRLESKLRKQAEAMVDDDPLQQTIKGIVAQRGFSPSHLRKLGYGPEMISDLRSIHRGLVTRNGTARADEIAMDTGIWDGSDALMEAIINSAPRKEVVERIASGLRDEQKTSRELNAADAYAELLNEEIKILSELTKGTTEAWENKPTPGIKRAIDEMMGIKKVSEAETITEYDALKAAMKKASTAARQAYTAGKRGGALAAKLKEREIFQIYKTKLESKRVVDRLTKALRKAVQIPANELKAGGIKPEYRDVIHSILAPYHRELKFKPSNPSGMTHAQFLQYMDDSGELTVHDPDRINAFTRKPWRELTINELREIKGAIGEIVYLGKREGKLITAGKKQDLETLVRSLAKRIYETTGKRGIDTGKTPQEVLEARDKGETSAPSLFQRYNMSRRKIEFLCRDLDGWEENGPIHQAIFQPAANAEAKQITMTMEKAAAIDAVFKSFSERIGGRKLSKWLNEKVRVPGIGKVFTRHRLMMVYLNSGNEGNLRALRSIFPQDQIDMINASFTAEEKAFFDELHALVDTLFTPLSEVYRAMTGQRLPKVEGRYWPIVLDQEMSMRAEEIKANESQKDLFANVFTAPTMKRGFEQERKGTSLPPKLDLSVLFQHLEQVIHRITHAEPVRNAQKIITHQDFKAAVIATRGRAFYDQFMPWLQYVANPRKDVSISVWDRGADVLRRNATLNLLGYSITVAMKSLFDWTVPAVELGIFDTMSGFYSYMKAPRETVAFVNSMSPEMTNFKNSFDRELGAMYEKLMPTMNPIKRRILESSFALLAMVEEINRYPVWLEAYMQATEGRGKWKGNTLNPEEAARWADQIVRRTKAMASPKDMAAITRGAGMQKLMTMFYTEASKIDNLMTEYWQRLRHDPKYGYYDYLRALFWIMVAGPILTETLIRRRPPKDVKEVGADISGMYFGRFPFIREVATAILTGYGYTPTPAVKGAESLASVVRGGARLLAGGKLKKDQQLNLVVSAADAMALLNPGPWGGFPTRQMITFLKGLADLQTGRAKTPAALYDRQAEKRRKEDLKAGVR